MHKKILFVTAPHPCGVVEVAGRWLPLTFAYLATATRRAGFQPVIYDAMTKRRGHADSSLRIRAEAMAALADVKRLCESRGRRRQAASR